MEEDEYSPDTILGLITKRAKIVDERFESQREKAIENLPTMLKEDLIKAVNLTINQKKFDPHVVELFKIDSMGIPKAVFEEAIQKMLLEVNREGDAVYEYYIHEFTPMVNHAMIGYRERAKMVPYTKDGVTHYEAPEIPSQVEYSADVVGKKLNEKRASHLAEVEAHRLQCLAYEEKETIPKVRAIFTEEIKRIEHKFMEYTKSSMYIGEVFSDRHKDWFRMQLINRGLQKDMFRKCVDILLKEYNETGAEYEYFVLNDNKGTIELDFRKKGDTSTEGILAKLREAAAARAKGGEALSDAEMEEVEAH